MFSLHTFGRLSQTVRIADIFKDYSLENLQLVPDESVMDHRPPVNPCGEGNENLADNDFFDYIDSFNLNYLENL